MDSCELLIAALHAYIDHMDALKRKQAQEMELAIYQSMVYGNQSLILSQQRIQRANNHCSLKQFLKNKSSKFDEKLLSEFWSFILDKQYDSEAIINDLKNENESNIIQKIRNYKSIHLRPPKRFKNVKDFKNEWQKGQQIGWGSKGNVFEVTSRKNNRHPHSQYVAKIMFFTESIEEQMNAVVGEYNFIKSSKLLNYIELFLDDIHKNKAIIVMHKLSHTLNSYRSGNLRDDQIKRIAIDLAQNIKMIHDHNYVHLDIKKENIMWCQTESKWKIIDYDLAKFIDPRCRDLKYRKFIGTKGWTAPEIALCDEESGDSFLVSKKSDIYSFGLVLLNLALGGKHYERIMRKENVRNLSEIEMLQLFASRKGNGLIQKCLMGLRDKNLAVFLLNILRFDASERPSIDDVIAMEYLKN